MRALITGAAGGIGSAIAASFEAAGHGVVRHDVRAGEGIDVVGDLLEDAHLRELTELARAEDVDTVVLAHGIAAAAALAKTDRALSDRAMLVNTISMLDAYDAFERLISERGGAFVAISSQAGLYGEADNGPYCASKFAVVGWARALARRAEGPRIRILCPGATDTPLLRSAFEGMASSQGVTYDDVLRMREGRIPAGRLGRVSDLGAAALWLAEIGAPRVLVAPVTGGEVLA